MEQRAELGQTWIRIQSATPSIFTGEELLNFAGNAEIITHWQGCCMFRRDAIKGSVPILIPLEQHTEALRKQLLSLGFYVSLERDALRRLSVPHSKLLASVDGN